MPPGREVQMAVTYQHEMNTKDINPSKCIDSAYIKKCQKRRTYTRIKIYIIYVGIIVSAILPNVLTYRFQSNTALASYMFACMVIFPTIATGWIFQTYGDFLPADIFPNVEIEKYLGVLKGLSMLSLFMIPWAIETHNSRIPMYTNLMIVYELLSINYFTKVGNKKAISLTTRLLVRELQLDVSNNKYLNDIETIVKEINKQLK